MSAPATEPSPSATELLPPVGLWTRNLEAVPATRTSELAAEIESLGYRMIWGPEGLGRDPFVHLSFVLGATERLIGATGIANLWGRDALAMSAAAKTLTEAFPERFVLGIGVSHAPMVDEVRGHRYRTPLRTMRDYLDAMDAAPFTAATPPTTPLRRVLAALGPKMMELAGRRTDGALTYLVPPEHTRRAREEIGSTAALCVEQAVVLGATVEESRELGRNHARRYLRLPNYRRNLERIGATDADFVDGGSDRLIDLIVAHGDEDRVLARVREHVAAGADHVCVQVLSAEPADVPMDAWRRLAPALLDVAPGRPAG